MSAASIQNRINEISFNSSLLRELRAIDFVRRLLEDGRLRSGEMRDVLVHSIRDDATMARLNIASKLAPEPELFDFLKTEGQRVADTFIRQNWSTLGKSGSVDLRAMFS